MLYVCLYVFIVHGMVCCVLGTRSRCIYEAGVFSAVLVFGIYVQVLLYT